MRGIFLLVWLACSCTAPIASAIDPPPQAMKLIDEFKAKEKAAKARLEAEIAALREKAKKETQEHKKQLVADLDKIRAALEKEEKHNEARAVAARIRSITNPPVSAALAPANMTAHAGNPANFDKGFIFRVTGRVDGSSVWGVGPYTSDSDIARAAVHAGVVANGETGFVKVTLISTAGIDFAGSTQNGVASSSYTSWPTGYRIERATSDETEGVIEAEDPVGASEDAISPSSPGTTAPPATSRSLEYLGPRRMPLPRLK
jgi:hypothetical protein